MTKALRHNEIIENLELLADWLRVKYPGQKFEMILAGGAAMALMGFKGQTIDIDLFDPLILPDPIVQGIRYVAKVKKLGPEWLNNQLAIMLKKSTGLKEMPEYFREIADTIEIGGNLKVSLIGRQALLSLKMYAATPSFRKHTEDIKALQPKKREIMESIRYVMSIDASQPRIDDLRIVLTDLGFDFDEILNSI